MVHSAFRLENVAANIENFPSEIYVSSLNFSPKFLLAERSNLIKIRKTHSDDKGGPKGDSDVGDFMMETDLRCWWQNHYVGDFFRYVT